MLLTLSDIRCSIITKIDSRRIDTLMAAQDLATNTVPIVARLTQEQVEGLDELKRRRKLARSVLLRQAIDLFLAVNITDLDSTIRDDKAA